MPSQDALHGAPHPLVFTVLIVPFGALGRGPDGVWGECWQVLHERIPENFHQMFERVPRFAAYRDRAARRFRGWQFVCAGRMIPLAQNATERMREQTLSAHRAGNEGAGMVEREGRWYVRVPCGKRVDSMFCPLPVWTIAKYLGEELAIPVDGTRSGAEAGGGLGLAGSFAPGLSDPTLAGFEDWSEETVARSFACARCWKVRHAALTNAHGWNEFVSHLSGGLLYGREVARPAEAAPVRRRRAFTHTKERRRIEPSAEIVARRGRVLGLLVAGRSRGEIAAEVGATIGAVNSDVEAVYRGAGVRTREELRRKGGTRIEGGGGVAG